jgi:uncharacterized membrane protein
LIDSFKDIVQLVKENSLCRLSRRGKRCLEVGMERIGKTKIQDEGTRRMIEAIFGVRG